MCEDRLIAHEHPQGKSPARPGPVRAAFFYFAPTHATQAITSATAAAIHSPASPTAP
jgi:hypothetical protein